MIIAFDGIDGSGKTTLVKALSISLRSKGINVYSYYMGAYGFFDRIIQDIRNDHTKCTPEIRELLYYFEGNLLNKKIAQKKESKDIILLDRYILTYYANGVNNGITFKELDVFLDGMIWPDYYFFLEIKPEDALSRILKYRKVDLPEVGYFSVLPNEETDIKAAFIENQYKVIENYNNIIRKNRNIIYLDANKTTDLLVIDICKYVFNAK